MQTLQYCQSDTDSYPYGGRYRLRNPIHSLIRITAEQVQVKQRNMERDNGAASELWYSRLLSQESHQSPNPHRTVGQQAAQGMMEVEVTADSSWDTAC